MLDVRFKEMTRYYEDLQSEEVFETDGYTVTKAEIVDFATQFDPQPFHIDEEAAQESMFGELVASGLHTLCISVRLFVQDFIKGEGVANMGGLGMDNLRWHEPVYPGDTLHVEIELLDKSPSESRSDRGYVDFERTVYSDTQGKVMSITSHNIIERESKPK